MEMYPHNHGVNTTPQRQNSNINGSIEFNNGFTQVGLQRKSTIRSSFSDESEIALGMRPSVDLSSRNSDYYGASSSSDESIPQNTV